MALDRKDFLKPSFRQQRCHRTRLHKYGFLWKRINIYVVRPCIYTKLAVSLKPHFFGQHSSGWKHRLAQVRVKAKSLFWKRRCHSSKPLSPPCSLLQGVDHVWCCGPTRVRFNWLPWRAAADVLRSLQQNHSQTCTTYYGWWPLVTIGLLWKYLKRMCRCSLLFFLESTDIFSGTLQTHSTQHKVMM